MNIGFLASHNGSNVASILDAMRSGFLESKPRIIISNNASAGVFGVAKKYAVPAYCINEKTHPVVDVSICEALLSYGVDFVVLAGYMKRFGSKVIGAFPNRVLNIHPSLLPKYGGFGMYGSRVHAAVIASNDVVSGASVHLVSAEYDQGPVVAQVQVPRYFADSVDSLSERVSRFERVLYSQVLRDIENGIIDLDSF